MKDILFKTENFVFSYRIAGILIHNGKMLLQKPPHDNYSFIGGHVTALETSKETLVREFKEELHVDIIVDNLLAVGEIFFPWGNGKPCHSISLFYPVRLLDENQLPLEGTFHGYNDLGEERLDLDFCWVPLDELKNIQLYQAEIVPHVLSGNKEIMHFVYNEE